MFANNPDITFEEAFGGDVAQQKLYQCLDPDLLRMVHGQFFWHGVRRL